MMDIRVKAALKLVAVMGTILVVASMAVMAKAFMTNEILIGVAGACIGGFALYNLYQMFLVAEEIKEVLEETTKK